MKTTIQMLLTILATIATLTIVTSSIVAGEALAANGPPSNANPVGSAVSKNGADSLQRVQKECITLFPANQCGTGQGDLAGPGEFASSLAHAKNKP